MNRLNQRAFDILRAEIQALATKTGTPAIQVEIALQRLAKLRQQAGSRCGVEELRHTLNDVFPTFSEPVLKRAARANRPPSRLWQSIQLATVGTATIAGGLWVLNLPYPMIRYPVAKVAPIVLLPSFMSMDHHYRQAIALVEQADQLVNQATSAADFARGAEKAKAAQASLDQLPVWFLGYYPNAYCTWMQCSWRFSLDEFEHARKEIARIDARVFQEQNALTQLEQVNLSLGNAKQQYQEAPNEGEKTAAIAQWQQALDRMEQIPVATLAGKQAQTQQRANQRDFEQVVGFTATSAADRSRIEAAREIRHQIDTQFDMKKPHSVEEWEAIGNLWERALTELRTVKDSANRLKADYEAQRQIATVRLAKEQAAARAYTQAKAQTEALLAISGSLNRGTVASKIYAIEQLLDEDTIQNTTVSKQARTLRAQAAAKRKQLSPN